LFHRREQVNNKIQLVLQRDRVQSVHFEAGLKTGDVVWVDPKAARDLLESGVCAWPKGAAPSDEDAGKVVRRADGWPHDRFAVIQPVWKGKPVVCIGGGPSVTKEALELIGAARARDAIRVIAVNDAYLVAPWADVCYFADERWWKWHTEGSLAKHWPWVRFSQEQVKQAFADFSGIKVSIEPTGLLIKDPAVMMMHSTGPDGLEESPRGLRTGSNGGYQAINLAVLAGGNPVLLIGYDMRFPHGKSHSHNGHPVRHTEDMYVRNVHKFRTMVPTLKKLGVEVINCTPESAVDAFPQGDLASFLAHP
jgi:hypothetical protein